MRGRRASRGISLIEVLVALAILAISLLGLAPLFSFGVKGNASSNELGLANTLAREKLEELIEYPTTNSRLFIPSGASTATFSTNDLPAWYNPTTGQTAAAGTPNPGNGWYPYPFSRTYTVTAYSEPNATTLSTVVNSDATVATNESAYDVPYATPYYNLKLVTVTVQPTSGPLPGLRKTVQSGYVRFRNALPPS